MSLINRMLDDLAARQAPGAETLSGVRLSDPMGEANASLTSRTRWVLIAIALGAAALVWFLWPTRGLIPVPQPRGAVGQPGDVVTTAAAITPTTADTAPMSSFRPGLRFETSLASLRSAEPGAARPSRIEESADEGVPVVASAASEPAARELRSVPRAPVLRAATSISPVPERPARAERRNSHSPRSPAPAPAAPGIQAAGVAEPASIEPAATPTTMARDALSRGDPAAALQALGAAGSDRDAETAALRAAALQRLGRHREASDTYRGLTQGDPTEPGHWVGLAISLEGQQKREEARIAYRRALQSSQLAPSLRAFAQARVTVLEAP